VRILLLIVIGLACSNILCAQSKKITMQVKATTTSSFCGGAQPTEEIMERMRAPRPINETKFYIIKGAINKSNRKIIDSFTTSPLGEANIRLLAGTFSIIEAKQILSFTPLKDSQHQTWNNECLLEKWQTPLITFKAKRNKLISFNIHKPCSFSMPCGKYTGPLPG
jgi:hypothetical protein